MAEEPMPEEPAPDVVVEDKAAEPAPEAAGATSDPDAEVTAINTAAAAAPETPSGAAVVDADEVDDEVDEEGGLYEDASETDSDASEDNEHPMTTHRIGSRKPQQRTLQTLLKAQFASHGTTEGEPPESPYVPTGPSPEEAFAAKVAAATLEREVAAATAAELTAAAGKLAGKAKLKNLKGSIGGPGKGMGSRRGSTASIASLSSNKGSGSEGGSESSPRAPSSPPPGPAARVSAPSPPPPPENPGKVLTRLMLSPDVAGAVKRWWKELGAGDAGALTREEYVALSVKLLFLLGEEHDPAAAVAAAWDDYHHCFDQATAALSYQQFYKAIFTQVHQLFPGHKASGYSHFLDALFEQWTR
eukprot:CAMPEP_0197588762 /NCGR_PEP_ID=MMETSP1326-20131121/9930_1 /TAXON_ID=1155430 /ORGANISM="Genus nov. species nov., Strain RCC2288" /LENGTH=358 /DNA_ID=CAMNT_0043153623 /DNA_START=334 /DNA_END=1406 /DNA_ORIENTATION=+